MRRVTMMLAAMAVMVPLFAAVAYAATIEGTNKQDYIFETNRDDTIFGRDRGDAIDAAVFGPNGYFAVTAADEDKVYGNTGGDQIDVRDGDNDDKAKGGKGDDTCWGDVGDDLDCETENPPITLGQ